MPLGIADARSVRSHPVNPTFCPVPLVHF
jgi:hypothetical protein